MSRPPKLLGFAVIFSCCITVARGDLRVSYEDATVVERSELIAVGHLKKDSIHYIPHHSNGGGASWHHNATLIVTRVIKGKSANQEIPITIQYGMDPFVGGYPVPGHPLKISRGPVPSDEKDKIEIHDVGKSPMRPMPLVADAGKDNLWFLRRVDPKSWPSIKTGIFEIRDPEDLQPLNLHGYFEAYLAGDPSKAAKYVKSYPELGERIQRYLDHLKVREILRISDPAKRFDALLPFYMAGQTWNSSREARQGIVDCGKAAGEKIVALYQDPKYQNSRQDFISLWKYIGYREAAPLLIKQLEDDDRFWARQKLEKEWRNEQGPAAAQRSRIYGETYYAVSALGSFVDPRARDVLEKTKHRWEAFHFENNQIVEACTEALKALSDK